MPKVKSYKSNKGRKKVEDPKVPLLLMVNKSKIAGKDGLSLDVKSDEFKTKANQLKSDLYNTIDFIVM